MSIVAIIQARMGSTRFPGKVLEDLRGTPVLGWVVTAARAIPGVDEAVVATSDSDADAELRDWCDAQAIRCVTGSQDDVLDRYRTAAQAVGARLVLRLTADCPFLDPWVCGQVLALLERSGADYASNVDPPSWPDGLDCEAFTRHALEEAARRATRRLDREHVTPYLRANRCRFRLLNLRCPLPGLSRERWTVDRPPDLEFLRATAEHLPATGPVSFLDVLRVLDAHPELREINKDRVPNEGFLTSRLDEGSYRTQGYASSWRMLDRARKVIPLGSQTFSKSYNQYPYRDGPLLSDARRRGPRLGR